eukprot:COSAG02_NODE_40159_length_408_cov_1.326861_1_plen_78_part_01
MSRYHACLQVIVGFIVATMFFTLRTMYLFRPPVRLKATKTPDSAKSRCVVLHLLATPASCVYQGIRMPGTHSPHAVQG